MARTSCKIAKLAAVTT